MQPRLLAPVESVQEFGRAIAGMVRMPAQRYAFATGVAAQLAQLKTDFAARMPGVPLTGRPPVILDFATSVIAQGKTRVAHNKGEPVPEGGYAGAYVRDWAAEMPDDAEPETPHFH